MKIIFSNYDDVKNPYYGGGGAIAVFEVAKRLCGTFGHDVTVITGRYPGAKDEVIEGVRYKRIGPSWVFPKLGQIIYQLILPYYCLALDYDVWLESFTPPYSTAFLPWFTRKPVIGVAHLLSGKSMHRKYHIPFHLIERFGLRSYRHLIVLSEEIRADVVRSHGELDIRIIPNGVSRELIDLEFEKSGEYILFLGRIDIDQKGLDLLLRAYKHVVEDISLDLVIAGGGMAYDVERLEDHIGKLGLRDRVRYIGKIVGEDKDRAYRMAKIFVMSSRYEALPLTLFEAFAYKCALVYFGIDVLGWIPRDLGVRVRPFDVEAFGKAMLDLSRDEDRVKALGLVGKARVKGCDWESAASKYEKYITKIAKKPI